MGWDVTKPQGSSEVSAVDDQIRADKQTLKDAIGAEHDFTESTTTGGHREGSARCWVDVEANRETNVSDQTLPEFGSNSYEGRLFYETDTTKLYYGDSGDAWQQLSPKRNITQWSFIQVSEVGGRCQSDSWVDYPQGGGAFDHTITTTGGDVLATVTVHIRVVVGDYAYITMKLDSTYATTADNGLAIFHGIPNDSDEDYVHAVDEPIQTVTVQRLFTDVGPGTHTLTVQWKVETNGDAYQGANLAHTILLEEV